MQGVRNLRVCDAGLMPVLLGPATKPWGFGRWGFDGDDMAMGSPMGHFGHGFCSWESGEGRCVLKLKLVVHVVVRRFKTSCIGVQCVNDVFSRIDRQLGARNLHALETHNY